MRFLFSPRLLAAHLAVVVCILAAGGLGVWQYDAWHNRRVAEAVDLTHQDPVALDDLMGPNDPFPGRQVGAPVLVRGTWLPDATIYVSGREHDGRAGYWVVTPLTDGDSSAPAIAVVRGWTPTPADAPAPPTGTGTLVGWLQPSDSGEQALPGAQVIDPDDPGTHDDVVPDLRVAQLVQRVTQDLYSGYVVNADNSSSAAQMTWPDGASAVNDGTTDLAAADLTQLPPASRFTAIRNLFYAIEWWFFGGFAVFVWWRFVRDERNAVRGDVASPAEAADGVSRVQA